MAERVRTLTVARLLRSTGQSTIFERSFAEDVRSAISPSYRVELHHRLWRFSRVIDLDSRTVGGQLGFERVGAQEAARFNEETQEYEVRVSAREQGNFSHYVLDLESQYLLFEERASAIRRHSFVRAFRTLLRQAPYNLRIDLVADGAPFNEWLTSIDQLIVFRARWNAPNPKWKGSVRTIRRVLQDSQADEVDIVLTAQQGSLQHQGSVIAETVEYGAQANATYKATARKGDGLERYDSEQARAVIQTTVTESTDDDTTTILSRMRDALRRLRQTLP